MKLHRLSNKKIKYSKKDIVYLLLFFCIFLIISQSGLIKYLVLSGTILFAFLWRKKTNPKYYLVLVHSLLYSTIGLALCLINGSLSFNSIKQLLIYICSGLFAISIISVYGIKNSARLLDIQFTGLCLAYLTLYARFFTIQNFYYESNIYAYIFGVYGLIYFWQKRYCSMVFAMIFMLFDHKRITTASFVIVLVLLFIVRPIKKEAIRRFINALASIMLFILPIIWVYFCSSGFLQNTFARFGINTMGRLEGTGAWNLATQYYTFSPRYIGKGIGWVLEWLEHANIMAFSNLHNDFLAGYIELGFIGFIVWIASFQVVTRNKQIEDLSIKNLVALLFGFMFLNFLTDNIYLYVTFLMPFYIVILSLMYGEDRYKFSKKTFCFPIKGNSFLSGFCIELKYIEKVKQGSA